MGYWEAVLALALVNGIAAWSLGIAIRAGSLSVGHAALMGFGGYSAALIVRDGGSDAVAILLAIAVAAGAGLLLSLLTLRLDHLFLALATLVFAEISRIIAADQEPLGRAAGLAGIPLLSSIWPVLVVAGIIVVVELALIRRTRSELFVLAYGADPVLVETAGVPAWLVRTGSFTVSAAFAGLSGYFYGRFFGVIQPPDLTFAQSVDFLVFAVVGGVYSGYGPLLGATALTVIPEVWDFPLGGKTTLFGLVLLVVTLVRPDGLIPRRRLPVARMAALATGPRPPRGRRPRLRAHGTAPTTIETTDHSETTEGTSEC
ncbi:MAG: branched-chain amino acid ABC transporter permease [Acidimicrobiales bacterium]